MVKKVHKDWLCLEFAPAVLFSQKSLICDEVKVIEIFVKFRFKFEHAQTMSERDVKKAH